MTYIDYLTDPKLMPYWMGQTLGEGLCTTIGLMRNVVAQGATEAGRARFFATGSPDVLPHVGVERQIERAPGEADPSYRTRLLGAWATWGKAGTPQSILTALGTLGYSSIIIKENGPSWAPDGDITQWWRFWVYISSPLPYATPTPLICGTPGLLCGTGTAGGLPVGEVDRISALIHKWKPAHAQNQYVSILLYGGWFGVGSAVYGGGGTYGSSAISFAV